MADRVNARPGSKVWRRVDGKWTGLRSQVSGAGYVDQFPGATTEEVLAAQMKQPGGFWIVDSNATDDPDGGFEIEKYLPDSVTGDNGIVVLAPSKPPFGEWTELDKWPSDD
ncbi:hypothetical protein [Nocardia sp. CDC160]|uniref:hypothetical protein n=1 Tax=Nocardia sp. CDC160 TaxID=3112166 RepID=UPI002DBBAB38|nr:hypothetical protein [Nocardia sp. CDC160]MEC3920289.1 hypothetical protein [Nocardia sp. CDC160]